MRGLGIRHPAAAEGLGAPRVQRDGGGIVRDAEIVLVVQPVQVAAAQKASAFSGSSAIAFV